MGLRTMSSAMMMTKLGLGFCVALAPLDVRILLNSVDMCMPVRLRDENPASPTTNATQKRASTPPLHCSSLAVRCSRHAQDGATIGRHKVEAHELMKNLDKEPSWTCNVGQASRSLYCVVRASQHFGPEMPLTKNNFFLLNISIIGPRASSFSVPILIGR